MAVKKKSKSKKSKNKNAVKKISQRLVDEALVKISPALLDNVNKNLGKIGDLTFLAGRILFRAQEISQNLKQVRQRKAAIKAKKKASKKRK